MYCIGYDEVVVFVIFVNGVDFTCLGVAFEEFLGYVFAGSDHVDRVVAEVGYGSEGGEGLLEGGVVGVDD